jgi:hypothetical protein
MSGYTIEVYYDPLGRRGGISGCFRARVAGVAGIHDAGRTPVEAYRECVVTAASLGLPAGEHNYRMDVSRLEK